MRLDEAVDSRPLNVSLARLHHAIAVFTINQRLRLLLHVLSRRALADDAQTLNSLSSSPVARLRNSFHCELVSQQQHCLGVISALLLPANSLLATTQLHHACHIPLLVTTRIAMKSMQRRFGAFGKRSDDQADVGVVMAEFKAADDMIERV